MKGLPALVVWLLALARCSAADPVTTNDREAAQWQRIYERLEKRGITNAQAFLKSDLGKQCVVHPAFGIDWDEVPPPTLTNSSAMAAVNTFIATNGWNTYTGGEWDFFSIKTAKSIRGLPWKEVQDRDFSALTQNGILYVMFRGFHYNANGIAYNPRTNAFPAWMTGFKPLKNHWYVWALPEEPTPLPRVYEGTRKRGEPAGAANGSQPFRSDTNRTSGAAGPRR